MEGGEEARPHLRREIGQLGGEAQGRYFRQQEQHVQKPRGMASRYVRKLQRCAAAKGIWSGVGGEELGAVGPGPRGRVFARELPCVTKEKPFEGLKPSVVCGVGHESFVLNQLSSTCA